MLFGSLLLAPFTVRESVAAVKNARAGLAFIALSGLSSALAVISLYFALGRADVVIVVPISSINPLVTLLMARLFLERLEQVTRWVLAGTVLVVAGVALVITGSAL